MGQAVHWLIPELLQRRGRIGTECPQTRRKYRGIDISLAICSGRDYYAHLKNAGVGSVFTVRLPFQQWKRGSGQVSLIPMR